MKKPKLSEIVYKAIKEKIISNEFMPGQALQEKELAEMLEVSRTPVREALFQLGQDRWVDMHSQKTVIVSHVTLDDVRDIFELRVLIETYVLEEIFKRGLNRQLAGELDGIVQEMKQCLGDQLAFSKRDRHFHAAFVDILENRRLTQFWKRVTEEITRVGILGTKSSAATLAAVVEEHQKLAEALWNGQLEEAQNFLSQIRTKTYDQLIKEIKTEET